MTTKRFFGKKNSNIFYAITSVILLCSIFAIMMHGIFKREEKECYENLNATTKLFKDNIQEQINYNRETLTLVANLATELYEREADLGLVFESYKTTGLIDNVGILQPDNTFLTKNGVLNFDGMLSFNAEVAKGEYISGRVKDVTNNELDIIRIAKPIISEGEVIGILYGSINLDDFKKRYIKNVSELDAQLYIYERGNGNLILDTMNDELGNIVGLKSREYEEGYSYEKLTSGESGYSVFTSEVWNEKLFVHYQSLGVADWEILLAQRETDVFKKARYTLGIMYLSFLLVGIVLAIYSLYLLQQENTKKRIITECSQIRKLLLDINKRQSNIMETLKKSVLFSKARSAIFIDTDEDDYHYILPEYAEESIAGDDRKYFISEIFGYATELRISRQKSVDVISIKVNSTLEKSNKKFYDLLVGHDISEIVFASVTDKNNRISILGVINPKKADDARALLADIAVCFSIAIRNKNNLNRAEIAATTDSLTGLANHAAYKKAVKRFDNEHPENFACVYADVNDLHLCNNRYGHAAGDEMLIYIANTLKEVFYGYKIYRVGGDEFLVFVTNTDPEWVEAALKQTEEILLPLNYHVAMGMSFRAKNTDTDDMIKEAERKMYDAKAQYYQDKDAQNEDTAELQEYNIIKTGNDDVDALLATMKYRFCGIYTVSMKTDEIQTILLPTCFKYSGEESSHRKLFARYVEENVNPDFHRALLSFLNYETLLSQLNGGIIPKITYKKTNGENITLSIYPLADGKNSQKTLWVFEKKKTIDKTRC